MVGDAQLPGQLHICPMLGWCGGWWVVESHGRTVVCIEQQLKCGGIMCSCERPACCSADPGMRSGRHRHPRVSRGTAVVSRVLLLCKQVWLMAWRLLSALGLRTISCHRAVLVRVLSHGDVIRHGYNLRHTLLG
jgi:hypothetical protein